MIPKALTIIHDEHRALAAVLHALRFTVRQIRDHGAKPDFEVLRSLLFYIDAYPERLHHPKESHHLFRLLRERHADASPMLDKLDQDHERGERAILDLEHQLLEYEMLGSDRLSAFAAAVEKYCDRYVEHMMQEERDILPLAQQVLTAKDWDAIDAEFAANRDPLAGHEPEKEFETLFRRIVNLLPPPLGLGPMH